jgi:hypothetical protein
MKRLVSLLAVMGTTLALAAGMALAQATQDGFHAILIPYNAEVFNSCTDDEVVHLTGEIHLLFHLTEDANGGISVQTHAQPQGVSGTALESGTQYNAVGVTRQATYFAPGEELRETTFVHRFTLISKGPSDNLQITQTIHVTFNANGEPTAEIVREDIQCAG